MTPTPSNKITFRSLALGVVVAAVFAAVTAYFDQRRNLFLAATQIAVLPYVLLVAAVLAINPLCRLIRLIRIIRPFTTVEVMAVFIMGSISAGIATFGLSAQLMPIAGSLFNRHWNNAQSQWDQTVTPFLNESYFLAEPGLQQAGDQYRRSLHALRTAKQRLRAAQAVVTADQNVARLQRQNETDNRELNFALRAQTAARKTWQPYGDAFDPRQTVESHPALIDQLQHTHDTVEAQLRALEEKAFVKVDTFRRGLPAGRRALPGMIKQSDESLSQYLARWRRLRVGLASLSKLREANQHLLTAGRIDQKVTATLAQAAKLLQPVSDTSALDAQKQTLLDQDAALATQKAQIDAERFDLSHQKPMAAIEQSHQIARRITQLDRQIIELDRQIATTKAQIARLDARLKVITTCRNARLSLDQLAASVARREVNADQLSKRITEITADYVAFDASLRRFIVGQIPWSQWLSVLARWTVVIGLTYVILLSFNVLIFRQ